MFMTADTSQYKIFKAMEPLRGAYHAVTLIEGGVVESKAGDYPLGILTPETPFTPAGEDVNVKLDGVAQWLIGEEIHAGDYLTVTNDGIALKAHEGDFIFAIALEDAVEGAIRVRIVNLGVAWVLFEEDEYNVVKIFFNFPISRHRRWRAISMPNPRADLTREEIKEVGQYAVDNKIILNTAGEIATGVTLGALKKKEIEVIKL